MKRSTGHVKIGEAQANTKLKHQLDPPPTQITTNLILEELDIGEADDINNTYGEK